MRRPILRLGFGGSVLLALVIGWWYFLPTPLFTVPYSTVILDKEGEIMGMTVASDGQYRVSGRGRLSMKYMAALLCFEDKRFLTHSGVDPLAIGREDYCPAGFRLYRCRCAGAGGDGTCGGTSALCGGDSRPARRTEQVTFVRLAAGMAVGRLGGQVETEIWKYKTIENESTYQR